MWYLLDFVAGVLQGGTFRCIEAGKAEVNSIHTLGEYAWLTELAPKHPSSGLAVV